MAEYGTNHMYPNYQPHSPYGQPNQSIYNQCKICLRSLFLIILLTVSQQMVPSLPVIDILSGEYDEVFE